LQHSDPITLRSLFRQKFTRPRVHRKHHPKSKSPPCTAHKSIPTNTATAEEEIMTADTRMASMSGLLARLMSVPSLRKPNDKHADCDAAAKS
jgi:hypothetical protein